MKTTKLKQIFSTAVVTAMIAAPISATPEISFDGISGGDIKIVVFNILGQEIESFEIKKIVKGEQFFDLNLNNLKGLTTGSGMVFVRLETNKEQVVRKCVIIKN